MSCIPIEMRLLVPVMFSFTCTLCLQGTFLSNYIPFYDLHNLHTTLGHFILWSSVFFHSLPHIIRWGLQGNLSFLVTRVTGATGLLAMVAAPCIVLPMLVPALKRRLSWEVFLHFPQHCPMSLPNFLPLCKLCAMSVTRSPNSAPCVHLLYTQHCPICAPTPRHRVFPQLLQRCPIPSPGSGPADPIPCQVRKGLHHLHWVFGIALAFHAPAVNIFWIMFAVLLVYGLDALYGLLLKAYIIETAEFTCLKNGVQLRFVNPEGFRGGGYVLLCVPWLNRHQWHAFSLFSHPTEPNQSCVHISNVGDWTDLLHGSLTERPTCRPCWVQGPFASPYHTALEFDNIILVASGIGITPAIEVCGTGAQGVDIPVTRLPRSGWGGGGRLGPGGCEDKMTIAIYLFASQVCALAASSCMCRSAVAQFFHPYLCFVITSCSTGSLVPFLPFAGHQMLICASLLLAGPAFLFSNSTQEHPGTRHRAPKGKRERQREKAQGSCPTDL